MQIQTADHLDQALRAARFLLLKHSFRCGISARAFSEVEAFLKEHEIESGWIDVVAHRDLSLRAAERTGLDHASPQAILLKKGEVAWHASHFDITRAALAAML